MSTYALLGANGQVGKTILTVLAEDPTRKIRAFVRSKAKLQKVAPEICSSPNLTIFEGDLTNTNVLRECISGTKAVFMAIATNRNLPGTRVAQDQAEAVVAALEEIRLQDRNARLPTLIVLSSSETEEKFRNELPVVAVKLLSIACGNIYADLIKAETYLRARDDWLTSVFVKPGGLSFDIKHGHILSVDHQQTFLSYLDLAGGMVEIADAEGGRWDGKSVSVLSVTKAKPEYFVPLFLLLGVLTYFFPWLNRFI